jgi:poly-gamma-glutamate capsule biosynthesis protein CapA/YwtB (metallophosphatase superfamily)
MQEGLVTLFLSGDVMTGRGVDQILPHPGDPSLWEAQVRDARGYVQLAESVNGPIPRPVDFQWPWGAALATLEALAPDVRLINLETSVTRSDDAADDKAVHYRMAPENIGCLRVARPDVCALANNHVLDFGPAGLAETCEVLTAAGIPIVGAGQDAAEASRPITVTVPGGRRVIVFSCGTQSSGIPHHWAAQTDRAGVNLVRTLSSTTADGITERMQQDRRAGDVVVVSIHWGSNWGYEIPPDHVDFAHRLIDGGVDVVHGHSSHHVRPIEIYRGKLILHGCGDLIDDYEGIGGYEAYRGDLRVLYFVSVNPDTGTLVNLHMVPMRARQMRLHSASAEDASHLARVIERTSRRGGARVDLAADRSLWVRPLAQR